ncbi:hypothetical protein ABZU86_21115 [Streptomyces sp. NPDC005271]
MIAAAPGHDRGRTGGFRVFRGTDRGLSTRGAAHFTPSYLGIRVPVQ